MIGVYKKEIRSYRTSMIGYVFIAFILVVIGVYFSYINLNLSSPKFEGVLESIQFVFLVFVPILTMRVLAEEKKQKTDQLLLTLPLSVTDIVLGKFLALVTLYAVPMAIVCLYPLIMAQNGQVNLMAAYLSILGFFLLGCANMAIGLFLSSLTENPVIAAVMSFGLLLLCYLMNTISAMVPNTAAASFVSFTVVLLLLAWAVYHILHSARITAAAFVLAEAVLGAVFLTDRRLFEGAFQKFLSVFYMNGRLTNFFDGILDISGIAYYISIAGVALFLAVQTIRKRRWS